jgi:hypothetical protein
LSLFLSLIFLFCFLSSWFISVLSLFYNPHLLPSLFYFLISCLSCFTICFVLCFNTNFFASPLCSLRFSYISCHRIAKVCTRWFNYDRDKLWLVYTRIVPVIFEPPYSFTLIASLLNIMCM